LAQLLYLRQGDGSFACLGESGVNLCEGPLVVDVIVGYGSVVDGSQHSHVERACVDGEVPRLEVSFVVVDEAGVDAGQADVVLSDEA